MKRPCGTDEKQKTGRSIYGKVGKDKGISQKIILQAQGH
jgi:hypothetical protein